MFFKTREYRTSGFNLMFKGLRQPTPRLPFVLRHTAPKCVHHAEHVHRFSVSSLCQAPETSRRSDIPIRGLFRVWLTLSCEESAEAILGKGISLLGQVGVGMLV
jgi:hypothetical protein